MIAVDLFAGGGGASEGIRRATGTVPVVAINHDPAAIQMHAANHPGTMHLCEDVFAVKPFRPKRGKPIDLLWASPDCGPGEVDAEFVRRRRFGWRTILNDRREARRSLAQEWDDRGRTERRASPAGRQSSIGIIGILAQNAQKYGTQEGQ